MYRYIRTYRSYDQVTLVSKSLYAGHIMHPESSKISYEYSIRNAQYQVSAARGIDFVVSFDTWDFRF